MIAVDTNLLIYAYRADLSFHLASKQLLEGLRTEATAWAIPWPCIHEALAVLTNTKAFKNATTLTDAFGYIDALLASPTLHLLAEGDGYLERLRALATAATLKRGQIHDARIAALCLRHGVRELWSADRDFSMFPQLKVRNPLKD